MKKKDAAMHSRRRSVVNFIRQAATSRRRAFTLVELLVVIGIIALLIAMLMPVLSTARRQARTVQCLAHLRQLAAGCHSYLADNKGRWVQSIYYGEKQGTLWIEDQLFPQRRRGEQSKILFCPEATEASRLFSAGTFGPFWYTGGVSEPWGIPDTSDPIEARSAPFRGSSYGMNGWLVIPPPGSIHTERNERYFPLPWKDSSRVPLLADSISPLTNPLPADPPPSRLRPHSPKGSGRAIGNNVCIPRHGRAVNVAFLDGHARTVQLAELWKLKWNNDWTDTDVTLPAE